MIELKIGDILYTGASFRVMSYKVYEIRKTEDSILYAVECQNCNDHDPCKLLVAPNNRKNPTYFTFVEMLNNYIYDSENRVYDQTYSHSGEKFFTDKYSGVIEKLKKEIEYHKSELKKSEQSVYYHKQQINNCAETLEEMEKNKLNKKD